MTRRVWQEHTFHVLRRCMWFLPPTRPSNCTCSMHARDNLQGDCSDISRVGIRVPKGANCHLEISNEMHCEDGIFVNYTGFE